MQRYGKRLLEMLSQRSGLGSAANLDDLTREGLEEDLEEMIAEAQPRSRLAGRGRFPSWPSGMVSIGPTSAG